MAPFPALFLAMAFATSAAGDLQAFKACRTAARVERGNGCTWRGGSLFAVNGANSTRIAFRHGRPALVYIDQPGGSGSEFVPTAPAVDLHVGDLSSIDGRYLVCALRSRADPYDPMNRLDMACLAGADRLHAGTVAWIFPAAPPVRRRHRRS